MTNGSMNGILRSQTAEIMENIKKNEEICITDPIHYLEQDEYYKQNIQMRK